MVKPAYLKILYERIEVVMRDYGIIAGYVINPLQILLASTTSIDRAP